MASKTTPVSASSKTTLKLDPPAVRPSGGLQTTLLWLFLLIALAGFGWSFYSYQSVKKEVQILKDPQLASQLSEQQTKALLEKLSKLIILPADPNPVVAVINDVEALAADQDFYKDANNGDKVILFQKDSKAIIYNEEANRLVNVGPIYFNNADGTPQAAVNAADRLNIELRNGTSQAGGTTAVRDQLVKNYAFNVTRLGKAAKSDYTGYVLVDGTDGSKASLIESLQKELGATVVKEVPTGEADLKTEVMIIVGRK